MSEHGGRKIIENGPAKKYTGPQSKVHNKTS